MRAREPDKAGWIERDGVRIAYEVFGDGEPTVVFAPIDPIVESRAWKAQVPWLSRRARVVTIDPRGNGRSDRPTDPALQGQAHRAADTVAVMDNGRVVHAGSMAAFSADAQLQQRLLGLAL